MSVIWLIRIVSGLFLVAALAASAMTWHPKIQLLGNLIAGISGCLAVIGFISSVIMSRWPREHWGHRQTSTVVMVLVCGIGLLLLMAIFG